MSSCPAFARISGSIPATLAGLARSTTTGIARGPSPAQIAASLSPSRSTKATVAPAASIACAQASPIPEAAPVTAATLPCSASPMLQARPCDTRLCRARLSTMTAIASTPPVIM